MFQYSHRTSNALQLVTSWISLTSSPCPTRESNLWPTSSHEWQVAHDLNHLAMQSNQSSEAPLRAEHVMTAGEWPITHDSKKMSVNMTIWASVCRLSWDMNASLALCLKINTIVQFFEIDVQFLLIKIANDIIPREIRQFLTNLRRFYAPGRKWAKLRPRCENIFGERLNGVNAFHRVKIRSVTAEIMAWKLNEMPEWHFE